jgi:hypothetical protein
MQGDEMEPSEVGFDIAGSNAASHPEEVLEAGMAVIDSTDVEFAANAFSGCLIESLRAAAQGG